jgi:peptidyl-prolyl cis-trans isomerase B (cyclophilin B)
MVPTILAVMLLQPTRLYFQPNQPVTISLKEAAQLALLDPSGAVVAKGEAKPEGGTFDLAKLFPQIWEGQTLYVQPLDKAGKPMEPALVVVPLKAPHGHGGINGLRIYPEMNAVLHTTEGDVTVGFSPEVAPTTVKNFMELVAGGLYTNVPFHRILPGFVIQGGDPTGTGTGGPGYWIDLESSDKQHVEGTLSMARSQDPNSAGSQFFICLARTEHLDHGYAAFGDVVSGLDVVRKIAATPLADPRAGKPVKAPLITSAELAPASPRKMK